MAQESKQIQGFSWEEVKIQVVRDRANSFGLDGAALDRNACSDYAGWFLSLRRQRGTDPDAAEQEAKLRSLLNLNSQNKD